MTKPRSNNKGWKRLKREDEKYNSKGFDRRELLRGEIDATVFVAGKTPLSQREAKLKELEKEADKISEIEKLIDRQQDTKAK